MEMTDGEIRTYYLQMANKKKAPRILAQLNDCSIDEIKIILGMPVRSVVSRSKYRNRFMELYDQGLNDAEIAKITGVKYATINNYRVRSGLPRHKRRQA